MSNTAVTLRRGSVRWLTTTALFMGMNASFRRKLTDQKAENRRKPAEPIASAGFCMLFDSFSYTPQG